MKFEHKIAFSWTTRKRVQCAGHPFTYPALAGIWNSNLDGVLHEHSSSPLSYLLCMFHAKKKKASAFRQHLQLHFLLSGVGVIFQTGLFAVGKLA